MKYRAHYPWQPHLDESQEIVAQYFAYLNHPDFDEACFVSSEAMLSTDKIEPYFVKMVSTEARFIYLYWIIASNYLKNSESIYNKLTMSELYEADINGKKIASRNKINGIINILLNTHLVTVEKSNIDRRIRNLLINDRAFFVLSKYIKPQMVLIDSIIGSNYTNNTNIINKSFISIYCKTEIIQHAIYGSRGDLFPKYKNIFDITLGTEFLSYLWNKSWDQGKADARQIAVAPPIISEQFSVSRTHIRRLVAEFSELNLLKHV